MEKILYFVQNNKSYFIAFFICILSVFSIVYSNINSNNNYQVNSQNIVSSNEKNKIGVYITGEVVNPGVYYIDEESRLNDLIEVCGGFTKDADIDDLNLAEKLNDSDKVEVNSKKSVVYEENENDFDIALNGDNSINSDKVNINTAAKEELMEINGIGESTANKIIEYRKNSKFECIEDVKKVSGIGESKYNQIKDYIVVK